MPISENSPEPLPKISDSDILRNEPVIAPEKPNNKDNSLLTAKNEKIPSIINYQPQKLIGEISPKRSEKFSLPTKEIFSKREKFSLNNSEQLPVITNREQPNNKEQILLVKIKQLEKELVKVKAENEKLRVENKHLKALVQQDQATETKILQPLPFKIKT